MKRLVSRAWVRFPAVLVCLGALVATGCAADDMGDDGELGTFSFALTGVIPGVKAMEVKVFNGPVTSLTKVHKFELGCIPYVTGADSSNNAFTLDKLPARDDYSILVNLYSDDACTKLTVRGYRGGITVAPGTEKDATKTPYYIQPYRMGKFTGLATASAIKRAEVQKLSCTTESDCRGASGHPAATCVNNQCNLDSLFPLNGGAGRAFPNVVALPDGRVAISGGFSVQPLDGRWTATKERVEVFDPTLGRFLDTALSIDNFGVEARVGLGTAIPWTDSTFVQVGGQGKVRIKIVPQGVVSGLMDAECAGGAAACPVSKAVWHVDVTKKSSSGTLLPGPIALPVVAKVATSAGTRVLVAGGVEVPVPTAGDIPRRGEALLCNVSSGSSDCNEAKAKMKTGRANATWACVKTSASGCTHLLIIGGRSAKSSAAPLAEVYNAQTDTFDEVNVEGTPPPQAHGGSLVRAGNRFYLLGASGQRLFLEGRTPKSTSPIAPYRLDVDTSSSTFKVTFSKVNVTASGVSGGGARALVAAIGFSDGSAVMAGGVDAKNQIVSDAIVINKDGVGDARVPLEQARYGAGIAPITASGPLNGCALLAGGIGTANGGVAPTHHVEVYCPPAP